MKIDPDKLDIRTINSNTKYVYYAEGTYPSKGVGYTHMFSVVCKSRAKHPWECKVEQYTNLRDDSPEYNDFTVWKPFTKAAFIKEFERILRSDAGDRAKHRIIARAFSKS